MSRSVSGRAALGLLILVGAGCTSAPGEPEDPKLVKIEARLTQKDDYEARWQVARAYLDLLKNLPPSSSRKLEYAQRALKHAEKAIALDDKQVEGHYYRAVSLGHVLDNSTLPTRGKMLELEKSGKRAKEIDPSFDDAGPCLFLALLYQKAPAWPIGPELAREEDVIEELYQESIKLAPGCAENYLCYAEFLVEEDRAADARKVAKQARAALTRQTELAPDDRLDRSRRIRAILGSGKARD